jgi:alpha-1,3-rhamnosyl/mannosyltransferase
MDGRRLTGGVGRGVAGMLPHLAEHVDVTLLTDARLPPLELDVDVEQVALRVPAALPQLAWLELAVGGWLREHPRLFHGVFNTLPLRWKGPSVVTIHDLSFEVHPADFGRAQRRAWQTYARHAARNAGHVLTVSAFSASQLHDVYDVAAERVSVVPTALSGPFGIEHAGGLDKVLETTGLRRPYVAALGGAPRRSLPVAIGAWRRAVARGHDVDLAVVGAEHPDPEPGVVYVGPVDDDTWATVLGGAEAFVYATTYEGFGLPALEAMASGAPVVAARVGSVPEVLGDAGVWADAPTVDGLGDALAGLLDDPAARERHRRAGQARAAASPTWEDAADVVLAAYRLVAAS